MGKIICKNVSKIYNEGLENEIKAIDDVSFEIEEGEFVVILGPSGAGKSTLLNILGGMDILSKGSYIVGEKDVANFKEKDLVEFRRKNIGFVFQFYNLVPNLNALENILLSASVANNPLDAKKCLSDVGLIKRAGNYPSELSGGEQQRVAIARALIKNPDLLLCDEPTGALDSKTGAQVISLLYNVSKEYNKTVIMVTHNSKIALCAERLIEIRDGHISKNVIQENRIKPEEVDW